MHCARADMAKCMQEIIVSRKFYKELHGTMGQCLAKSPFCVVFQVLKLFDFRELQRASIKWSLRILNWTIHHSLVGTEFIISHTFQSKRYFSFACPGKFEKVSQG